MSEKNKKKNNNNNKTTTTIIMKITNTIFKDCGIHSP